MYQSLQRHSSTYTSVRHLFHTIICRKRAKESFTFAMPPPQSNRLVYAPRFQSRILGTAPLPSAGHSALLRLPRVAPSPVVPSSPVPSPPDSPRSSVTVSPPPTLPPSPQPLTPASPPAHHQSPEIVVIDVTPPPASVAPQASTTANPSNPSSTHVAATATHSNALESDTARLHFPSQSTSSPVIKRRRTNAVPSTDDPIVDPPKPAPVEPSLADQDDANCCSICLEPWTNSGSHQLCTTKCGHLFGYECIKEWLTTTPRHSRSCPSCKRPNRVKDLRYIFGIPSRFSTADVSQSATLRTQLEKEEEAHRLTKEKLWKKTEAVNTLRANIRDLSSANASVSGVRSFGDAARRPPDRLKSLTTMNASVDAQAVTFDAEAHLLFPEKFIMGTAVPRYRIKRCHIGRPLSPMTAPSYFSKKVTSLNVCDVVNSSNYRYIAASVHTRAVHILSPDLQSATHFSTPGIPSSCCWLSSNPYVVAVGMMMGAVCSFDIRHAANGPLYQADIDSDGWRLVHSLAEMRTGRVNEVGTALVAGAPKGVYAACLDGTTPRFQKLMALEADHISGLSVAGELMVVTIRSNFRAGAFVVTQGLRKRDGGLELGSRVGTLKHGLSFESPLVPAGITSGEADGRDAVVVCPDAFSSSGIGCWGFAQKEDGSKAWRSLPVEGGADGPVRGCAGFNMPRSSRVDSLPANCKSIFGCYSEERVSVYACGQHGAHLQT